ncbi:uncharacterized protein [Rutidosis leptorrhynchoides]|uniref:uncharacterized protein n=1 Tax=Rutidosis leptorrhynchoides TaxID=125765 RepID=UPI003A99D645
MSEIEKIQLFQEMGFNENDKIQQSKLQCVLMEAKDNFCNYDLIESDLDDSLESLSSSVTIDDDASSSSSLPSCSPLFKLSELMAQLPIKRGLSKFYQGKSESFASLTSVKSNDDLAKKGKYSCRSRKSMKSQRLSPKATITKNKKGSIFSSLGKMGTLMAN